MSRSDSRPAPPGSFVRDRVWHRHRNGTVLVAGSPATMFRVTGTGSALLDAIEADSELAAGHEALTDRLVFAGAVHPSPGSPWPEDDLTVVIPVHQRTDDGSLAALVAALSPLPVIVVDDASPVPVVLDDHNDRVAVVRLDDNAGPAGARNRGLSDVLTSVVAFIDADVEVTSATVLGLGGHLRRERVVAAAPRVCGLPGNGVVARHEDVTCPLDMGPDPSWVRLTARVRYVPSAVLVARTEEIRTIGGFDAAMRTGEDVDLVWRIADEGYLVRYDPSFIARHRSRTGLMGYLSQRVGYGASAGPLGVRHGPAIAPLHADAWDMAALALLVCGLIPPGAAILALSITSRILRLTRTGVAPRRAMVIAARTMVAFVAQVAAAVVRTWFPLLLVASLLSHRVALVLIVALGIRAVSAGRRARWRALPVALLGVLGDLAYCAGVWRGVIRARSLRALIPRFRWRPTPAT